MEFLGVGYQEILLVFVLLLVVVGPERMPAIAYQIGKSVRTLQRYARAVRDEFSDEFEYLDEQYREVRGELDSTRESLHEEQARLQREWKESTAELEGEVDSSLKEADSSLKDAGSALSANGKAPQSVTDIAAAKLAEEQADEVTAGPSPERQDGPPLVF